MDHDGTAQKPEQLPLLDEISDLIEKERTLLNLKLVAQKSETEEWKTKYDLLSQKLQVADAGNPQIEQVEEAAAVEESVANVESASLRDIHRLIADRLHSWVFDASSVNIEKTLFARVCKAVFGPRNSFDEIHVAVFNNCHLTDDYSLSILTALRGSNLFAIDLSNNLLGEPFFLQLINLLKDRRSTPQYMLLEGNIPLATTVKHFASIIDTLTDNTWGLTVSLQDISDVLPLAAGVKPSSRKTGRRTELNQDYKEIIKQPMRVHELLKAINAKLDPASDAAQSKSHSKKSMKQRSVIPGRENALHHLAVFGLKFCMLSRKSVQQLEETLHLVSSSLTDLDLSFSYVGFSGSQVLSKLLGSSGCQLIRLGLIGNALGDRGMQLLCRSLKANRTLTYLDARSNNISSAGLRSIAPDILQNPVLHCLDIRANAFTSNSVYSFQQLLNDKGVMLKLLWSYLEPTHLLQIGGVKDRAIQDHRVGDILLRIPHKVRAGCTLGRSVKLYSIDVSSISLNHPDKFGKPLLLRWKWRPAPIGTMEPGALQRSQLARKEKLVSRVAPSSQLLDYDASRNDSAYLAMGSSCFSVWEVRVSYNHQNLHEFKHRTANTSCVTRQLLSVNSDWAVCSVVLEELPLKGSIELWVNLDGENVSHQESKVDPRANLVVALEGRDLAICGLLELDHDYIVGDGDCSFTGESSAMRESHVPNQDEENVALTELLHSSRLVDSFAFARHALEDYAIVRSFRLNRDASDLIFSWRSKMVSLLVSDGTDDELSIAQTALHGGFTTAEQAVPMPPNHISLGYAWKVTLCSSDGSRHSIATGTCGGLGLTPHPDYSDVNIETSSVHVAENSREAETLNSRKPLTSGVLRAWSWKDFEVHMTQHARAQPGDLIVLAAKITSSQANYPSKYLQKCVVVASSCQLLRQRHVHRSAEFDPAAPSNSSPASLWDDAAVVFDVHDGSSKAVYDDASCEIPW